ncbi:MAG: ATPase, T2SS/T4P/T4SS family [Gaiellales bacterium]
MNTDDLRRRLAALADPAATPDASDDGPAPDDADPAAYEEDADEPVLPAEDRTIAELVADLIEATALLSGEALSRARGKARRRSFAQAIVAAGLAPRILAAQHGLAFVELGREKINPAATATIPPSLLERATALPYEIEGNRLRVAIADPTDVQAIDELRLATRYVIDLVVAGQDEIEAELKKIVRANEMWERTALLEEQVDIPEGDDLDQDDGISDAPLVKLVNSILLQAADDGASDVHFDPVPDALVVRVRVDGILNEMQRLPRQLSSAVITRLKVLAKLDIAERRKPQDGRISLGAKVLNRALDIRVAVLPTVEGEAVVLRLLDKSRRPPTLEELGFSPEMRSVLEVIVRKPTGALLVTGPTGSGKSTTLYAVLNAIHRPEINIITVEDPVEYRLAGVQQVQMNPKAQLTFASALRTILRSDPDVIMVGEIRDIETAKISIEAALTGHFVLSTLHTNDAPSALTRLNEMGVEPFLTGSAVTAVLAQRLARRLCSVCCEAYTPSREELVAARFSPEQIAAADGAPLYRRKGCPRCNHTGYKGRLGVFQLMVMGEELERLASERANRELIEQAARKGGMRGMWDDGLEKVLQGMTTVEELGRVLV